ncbi:C4-dicarboxylate ABC transporter permease [Agaricicola taiwanensis]|uniref:TRAP transporter large permease protein n=1 Tax=Agaricicola taiwanensis TaxID=591372 RepID=A0A8J2VMR4_9RHOB|nr:TRAP transporter large permease subunit [Agaricicola taiwanensis]GGE31303.1 C4-dicarboxylate ABC transporter permease [Agaricicola taiwanensis]
MTIAFLFASFAVLLLVGTPVAVALGGSVVLASLWSGALPVPIIGQKLYANLDHFTLMAVPFFFLAAALMETGGIVRHLVALANMLVGRFRGGLGMTAVLTCMFFAAISGSSPATVAAVGAIMIPALTKHGYPTNYAIGVVTTAGGLGILIPPSIPLILYGFVTETSIPKLFMAGILPGLLYGAMLMLMARFLARKLAVAPPEFMSAAEKARAVRLAVPALMLPVFLVIGIYGFPAFSLGGMTFEGGAIFTPTEAALLCATAALLIGVLIYRQTTLRSLVSTVLTVTPRVGMVFWIVTNAVLFGFFLAQQGVPTALANWLVSMDMPVWAFLLLVNLILIVAGMFLDGVPMILMFMPVLFPAAKALGVDPIHFGIMVVVNIELGLLTPPVGLNLFVASTISGVPLARVIVAVLPWACVTLTMLILTTYLPIISTFLPSLMVD